MPSPRSTRWWRSSAWTPPNAWWCSRARCDLCRCARSAGGLTERGGAQVQHQGGGLLLLGVAGETQPGVEVLGGVAVGHAQADPLDPLLAGLRGQRAQQTDADTAAALVRGDRHRQLGHVLGDEPEAGVAGGEPAQPGCADRDLQPAGSGQVDRDDPEVALALPTSDIQRGGLVLEHLLAGVALLAGPVHTLQEHVDEELGVLWAGRPDADGSLADLLSEFMPFPVQLHHATPRGGSGRSHRRTRLPGRDLATPVLPAPYPHESSLSPRTRTNGRQFPSWTGPRRSPGAPPAHVR